MNSSTQDVETAFEAEYLRLGVLPDEDEGLGAWEAAVSVLRERGAQTGHVATARANVAK